MLGLANIDMHEVTRLTRDGRLQEALDLLQSRPQPTAAASVKPTAPSDDVIDLSPPLEPGGSWSQRDRADPTARVHPRAAKQGLGDVIRERLRRLDPNSAKPKVAVPDGARFDERSFSCAHGTRSYRLFVPRRLNPGCALVVMLHGCTQGPEDFAIGTGMNALAEEGGFIVAYPAQTQSANPSKCWNWFRPGDQQRDAGEPAIIAGITRAVAREFDVDPARIYIAGLSAGGAAAMVMGQAYPDLYAAIGVHSGLTYRAANDVSSALAAMRNGAAGSRNEKTTRLVPTIVFHGDRDRTVHPSNGDRIVAELRTGRDVAETTSREAGARRAVLRDADGRCVIEHWLIAGAGHAWSGGNAAGSFTSPDGPNASEAMIRFFALHRLGEASR